MAVDQTIRTHPESATRRAILLGTTATVAAAAAGGALAAAPVPAGPDVYTRIDAALPGNVEALRRFMGLPAGDDPHVALWARWRAARAAVDEASRDTEGDLPQPLYDALWAIEDKIVDTVPTTMPGAAIVAEIVHQLVAALVEERSVCEDDPDRVVVEPELRGALSLAAFVREIVPAQLRDRLAAEGAASLGAQS